MQSKSMYTVNESGKAGGGVHGIEERAVCGVGALRGEYIFMQIKTKEID